MKAVGVKEPQATKVAKAWTRVTEPVRPSKRDIDFFRNVITSVDGPSIIVLGLTPELVDLALDLNATSVSVVEIRRAAIEEIPTLSEQDWGRVKFIHASWKNEIKPLQASADIVLAHGSFVHLAYREDWTNVGCIIKRYLRPGGKVVIKLFTQHNISASLEQRILGCRSQIASYTVMSDSSGREHFSYLTTSLKLTALSESILGSGVVDQDQLNRRISYLSRQVRDLIGGTELWDLFAEDYEQATPRDFEGIKPVSAPSLPDCIDTFESIGFEVSASPCPDDIFPGAFHYLTLSVKS